MTDYINIPRETGKNLKFKGDHIATVRSFPDQSKAAYSGSNERWTSLSLYLTQAGTFVCERVGHTRRINERVRREAFACPSQEGVAEFFGNDWLAKELYDHCGIEAVEVIA